MTPSRMVGAPWESATQNMGDEALLQEFVHRIVEVAHPERVVLFGSAARGNAGPHSDLDFLVVVRPGLGIPRRRMAGKILRRLTGLPRSADVVVVTTEDVEHYGDCPALVIRPALTEGRILYGA